MRLVFVNHAHPDVPHVSGMRTGYFAKEMARFGHQVVLLTCTVPGSRPPVGAANSVAGRLAGHNWAEPLVIAIPPVRHRALELIRRNSLPPLVRRSLTLWQLIVAKGVFADWHKAASSTITQLADEFEPDLIWATFGNTTNLAVAQQLAHATGCPWVADIKDSWSAFIPRALRRVMAWRFRDAIGWTSNSRYHQDVARRWLSSTRTEVIYSGVAEEFFGQAGRPPSLSRYQLLLVGSVYDDARLESYLHAVRGWIAGLPASERKSLSFAYAGADSERVELALAAVPLACEVRVSRYRSIPELAAMARASFANSYLSASFTFHHKLLELLICGRPLLCFPAERAESRALASRSGTPFASCDSEEEVRGALSAAWSGRDTTRDGGPSPPWRWADFAADLDLFFMQCLRERSR